ncbi:MULTISPECIES: glycosyltransferase family 2 protein [unclassified Rhizobium]|uniref:glycosyltransferase family 2 protein n=1 Tax=unclassified Rhizobium TaxID=2613769 RepID=UPI001ADC63BD|nr:glycosyltransferase family 2 protein [Rhizobium sp. 16-488-2b]MBO9173697.1 glycosyltransferase family 2 protein [Rhizobium sp. 16-488-2a]
MKTYSLVVPVYRNSEGIPSLIEALVKLDRSLSHDIEFVLVVDGSPDNSGPLLKVALNKSDLDFKLIFHSRNFGAFTAIRTGMEKSTAEFMAVMAADLQEPPELILSFFKILSSRRADVVFGKREGRNDPLVAKTLSNAFWGAYRRFVMPDMPKGGVDIFGCSRIVRDAIIQIEEPNSSLVAQLFWVGFRREFVPYVRLVREHGKSAWNFSRRLRYMVDSILSFSDLPIMLVLWLGVVGCTTSAIFGFATLVAKLSGLITETGYTSLILLTLFLGSLILSVQGLLGMYIWRTAENTKRRPLRVISEIYTRDLSE